MRAFLNLLICLALSLVGFVAGKSKFDDDVFFHHGNTLVEVWMGRTAVDVGDLNNQAMYDTVWKVLHDLCPTPTFGMQTCDFTWKELSTDHERPNNHVVIAPLWFKTGGQYWSEYERTLLIHTVADALRHVVSNNWNTYLVPGQSKPFATGPDFIRVNLPSHDGRNEVFLHLTLNADSWNSSHGRQFYCCPSRKTVDKVLDDVGKNYTALYRAPFSRDVRCLIDHMLTCEDCGPKCDACGYSCPNVCPKGKC